MNVFPFAMAEIASRRAVAGLARRRASAAWLTGHGRVQSVKLIDNARDVLTTIYSVLIFCFLNDNSSCRMYVNINWNNPT